MKKEFVTRLSITIIIMEIALFTMANHSVEATNVNIIEELTEMELGEEQVILQYDAETGQTTEINMDELKQNINQMYRTRNTVVNIISAYEGEAKDVDIITINNEDGTIQQNNGVQSISEGVFHSVGDTSSYTNRATCRLRMFNSDGEEVIGSGYLAGPNLLVTCAHCVMDKEDNDFVYTQWTAYPGYYPDNNDTDIGYCFGGVSGFSRYIYPSNWHSVENDWCICILENDLGTLANAWLGSQAYGTNAEMDGLDVKALGYPTMPGYGIRQMYTTGSLSWVTSNKFNTSSRIVKGMSGGPIVRASDENAIGISGAFYSLMPETGIGVRITQTIIDLLLENWPT